MSIKNRTVFYSTKGGQVKFLDWAHTVTSIGMMAEPFSMNLRGSPNSNILDYDPSDMMVKVDRLQQVEDEGDLKRVMSGVHGGNGLPRVLIFTGNN